MNISSHLRMLYMALIVVLTGIVYSLYFRMYLFAVLNGIVFVLLFLRAGNLRLRSR